MNSNTIDQVTLVNDKDEVIGSMDKVEAHRGEGKLHRAVSVYLFRRESLAPLRGEIHPSNFYGGKAKKVSRVKRGVELLIQQRSDKKIVGAHQWANTICGNVRPTESYEECAHRRLREELGITNVKIEPIYKFTYHLRCNKEFSEWEKDQVFIGLYDGEVKPNPDEVQECAWVDWNELQIRAKNSELRTQNFNTKQIDIKTSQLANQQTRQLILAPWFVHMLGDEELIEKIEQFIKK